MFVFLFARTHRTYIFFSSFVRSFFFFQSNFWARVSTRAARKSPQFCLTMLRLDLYPATEKCGWIRNGKLRRSYRQRNVSSKVGVASIPVYVKYTFLSLPFLLFLIRAAGWFKEAMERALASKNVDSSDFHVRDIYYRVINGNTEFREKIIFFFFFLFSERISLRKKGV